MRTFFAGVYILSEDVTFNPNRGDVDGSPNAFFDAPNNRDWRPTPEQMGEGGEYAGSAYR